MCGRWRWLVCESLTLTLSLCNCVHVDLYLLLGQVKHTRACWMQPAVCCSTVCQCFKSSCS